MVTGGNDEKNEAVPKKEKNDLVPDSINYAITIAKRSFFTVGRICVALPGANTILARSIALVLGDFQQVIAWNVIMDFEVGDCL